MHPIQLPNRPTELPATQSVIEFAASNDVYVRVVLRIEVNGHGENVALFGQAWQMTADGGFFPAPLGYPSRTSDTSTTFAKSAITSKTLTLGPGWVRMMGTFNPDALPEGAIVAGTLPTEGNVGDMVYVEANTHGFTETLWRYDEGVAMAHARTKAEELLTVIAHSRQLSGLSFF